MSALLAAEQLKLRTLRITFLVPAAVLGLVAIVTLLDAVFDPVAHNAELSGFLDTSLTVSAAAAAAYAAGMVGSEFCRRTISFDYLAVPMRIPVLSAKLLCFVAVGALLGLLAASLAHLVASGRDVPIDDGADIATRIAAVTIATAILGALGATVGILLRNPAVAVVAVIVWQPVEALAGGPARRRRLPALRSGGRGRPARHRRDRHRPGHPAPLRLRRRARVCRATPSRTRPRIAVSAASIEHA